MFNNSLIQWSPGVTLADIELQVCVVAYKHYRGNKTATARALDISIRTLEDRLEKYRYSELADRDREERERAANAEFLKRSRGAETPNHIVSEDFIRSERQAETGEERPAKDSGLTLYGDEWVDEQQPGPAQLEWARMQREREAREGGVALKKGDTVSESSGKGLGVQSASHSAIPHSVPVQKSEDVHSMLQNEAPENRKGRKR